MPPENRTEHLRLCRELFNQLRRIQEHKESAAAANLRINLPIFLKNFDLYLKWAERNSKVVDIAVRRHPIRTSGRSDTDGPVLA